MDHPARILSPHSTAVPAGQRWRLRRAVMALMAPALLALAAGCATGPDSRSDTGGNELGQALEQGNCRAAYDRFTADTDDVDTGLQVAHLCLQRGEFERARDLSDNLEQAHPEHSDRDYMAYLGSLARLGIWNRATTAPPQERIRHGREVFRHLAGFLEEHSMSRHAESLAPRLARLREDLADIELQMAEHAADSGREDEARDRLRYVRDHFPGTTAAHTAADQLEATE